MAEEIQIQNQTTPVQQAGQMDIKTETRRSTPTFFTDHLDKLILVFLIMFMGWGFMTLVHWNVTLSVLAFATSTVSGVVGALIALVTGKK